MEPKQVDFCVIKQKIIKTDEVLQMYLENNNKLKKTIQVIKELKCKYDRSQLENERCTFSLKTLKTKHMQLETQCEELINHQASLEQKYSQTLVDSHSHIKSLEDELQMLKELSQASDSLSPKKSSTTELASKKLEELEQQLATYKETENELKKEYNNLTKENMNLKFQLDKKNEEKMRALNMLEKEKAKVVQDLHCEMDNKIKLHGQLCHQKDKEIHELKLSLSDTNSLKKRVIFLEAENERLKKANFIKEQSLIEAKTNKKHIRKMKTVCVQTDASFFQKDIEEYSSEPDDYVTDILRYYHIPMPLSPCRSPSPTKFIKNIPKITLSDIPDIIVTPSTPLAEIVNTFPKNINNPVDIVTQNNIDKEPPIIKSIPNDDMTNVSCGNKIKNLPTTPVNNIMKKNLKRTVLLKNRKILKKRLPVKKKLKIKTQDNILRALQILNKSKINFTISNEKHFPIHCNTLKKCSEIQPNIAEHQINVIPQVEGLACNSQNCNEMYMLLNESNEGLLGFFNKKKENPTTSPNIDTRLDSKQDPIMWLQNKLKQEITPDNVLDKLAELVCEKIKNTTKRPNTFRIDSSGYISETEGELEHLFEKPSNDTLAVNALLMKKLREECLIRENKTHMGSEVSSEISLPSYLNDHSQTSSIAGSSKLYHSENDVMSTNSLSRAESNHSNSECNRVIGVSNTDATSPIIKLEDIPHFVEERPNQVNTSVEDGALIDCPDAEVADNDVKDCCEINNAICDNTTSVEDVSLIDWQDSSTSQEKDVKDFCAIDNVIDIPIKLCDNTSLEKQISIKHCQSTCPSSPISNFSTNNPDSIGLSLGANTQVTVKQENVEFPQEIKCELDVVNERKINILNVEIYKNFVKQENADKDGLSLTNTKIYEDIKGVKVFNLDSIKNYVEQVEAIKSEEKTDPITEIADNSSSDNGKYNDNDTSECTSNHAVNSPNFDPINYNFSPILATQRSPPTFLTPSPKLVEDSLSLAAISRISTAPSAISPLSDCSIISEDCKRSKLKKSTDRNKNDVANKTRDVKYLINSKFKALCRDKKENDSNETGVKPINDLAKIISPRCTRLNTNNSINSPTKNRLSVSEEESTTISIFSNADNCINSLLRDENILTEEVDSFLNIFQSNKSFSELNQSFANSTLDSKIPRQLSFTKFEKSSLNLTDISNKTTVSDNSMKTEDMDIKPECPMSPEPISKEAGQVGYISNLIKTEDMGIKAECPLSPEPISKKEWQVQHAPKIIPLERVEETDTSYTKISEDAQKVHLTQQIIDVLKETSGSQPLPITKRKIGRPRKINPSLEASKPTPLQKPTKTRLCKLKVCDSDEEISEFTTLPASFSKEVSNLKSENKRRISETSDDTSDSGVLDKEFIPKKATKRIPRKVRKKSTAGSDSPNEFLPSEELVSKIVEDVKAEETLNSDDEEKDSCSRKNKIECNPNQAVPVKRGRGRPRKYPKEDIKNDKNETRAKEEDCNQLTDTGCNKKLSEQEDLSLEFEVLPKPHKPMKKITKLQSKIMKQMKEKQKMFQKQPACNVLDDSSVGCDDRIKENLIETESLSQINNKNTNLSRKISNIQNEDSDKPEGSISVSGLNVQSDPGNVNLNPNNVQLNANFRKKKLTKNKNKSDLLSLIIKDMDRIKPQMKRTVIKREVPEGIGEKQWRKNVLEIAEIVHDKKNIDMKDIYGMEPYMRHRNGILVNGSKVPAKITVLLKKVLAIPNEDDIPESILLEFKRFPINEIIDIILYQISRDIIDKPDRKYDPAPLMTRTQRIFLGLLVRLEKEKGFENILETFFFRTQEYMFKRGCSLQAAIPLTRLFLSLCRLHANINRMRTFCCEAFFHAGDLAIPIFFTVLTSWIDVMPLEVDIKTYPLAKVLFQLVHLKTCKKPGYNLFPLKCLLSQYHGYQTERWDCDAIFDELSQEYLSNPCLASDYAIRLFCKNKDTKFVYKKLNEFFKPLIYKIPSENVNFKSATIILMGKICRQFKVKNEHDRKCLMELKRWFEGLLEDNPADLIKQSINITIEHLPSKRKRPNNHYFDVKTSNADTSANERTF
ncbi:unnamed protein product [Psylliodes chrysocephalus]|uniref:Uncharacterized protein n=1 Tax=Psylliodes chrysocephalus TaxID=3402493 RepID=A0A9P0G869_9CUCU|nr:unnamed protein product [Psylliodes chrysocephala]